MLVLRLAYNERQKHRGEEELDPSSQGPLERTREGGADGCQLYVAFSQ